jgi:ribosomal protein S14
MDVAKRAKTQKARELARWFREELRCGRIGEYEGLIASVAISLEREAFRCEREKAPRLPGRPISTRPLTGLPLASGVPRREHPLPGR